MERPLSALDVRCRGCGAEPGRKCGTVPDRSLVRRRIRAGNPIRTHWVKLLPYFHAMRERDFAAHLAEWEKLDAWEKHLSGKSA